MSRNEIAPRWYAIRTRSNYERLVTDELSAKAVESYCPSYREVRQWADRRKEIEVPLFRGYLLARFLDTPEMRVRILQCIGAVQILGCGARLEPLEDEEVAWIRLMATSGLRCQSHPLIREGATVRVKRGSLRGLAGILLRVRGETRVVLSIPMLLQSISVEVDVNDLEPVAGELRQDLLLACTLT